MPACYRAPGGGVRLTVMPVQVTQYAEFGPVVDVFIKLVKDERRLVIRGIWARDGSQRLPP
jgi:hypothetical protein